MTTPQQQPVTDPWATDREDGGYWNDNPDCEECGRINPLDARWCDWCDESICSGCAQAHAARCWPAEEPEDAVQE